MSLSYSACDRCCNLPTGSWAVVTRYRGRKLQTRMLHTSLTHLIFVNVEEKF